MGPLDEIQKKSSTFELNARVRVKTAPDKAGRITGKFREVAGRKRWQVDFGNSLDYVLGSNLEPAEEQLDIFDLLERGHYGGVINLRSAITHRRLTGRLADVIYSMEASNTEFFPYQFKPVLNFLDSPGRGILIADEVGLGKTIEAGLIWTELRARLDANRLLVLCPAVLREKWQAELAHRFGVRADICNAQELLDLLRKQRTRTIDGFAAIASMQGARPPRGWEGEPEKKSGPAELARFLAATEPGEPLFDCVVIDEAHYLRNPDTQTHELASLVREIAEHLLLLSATPIQLRSKDLFHLLALIDSENFQFESAFQDVLTANRPLVEMAGGLRRKGMSRDEFVQGLDACLSHPLLHGNRQLRYLKESPPDDSTLTEPAARESYATRIERVNLLARVVNRTRKRDVQTNRVIRDPVAPEVEMNGMEQEFYSEVTSLVRRYCWDRDLSEGFILTIPQRQMCSSMPAAFRAWKNKRIEQPDDNLSFESGVEDTDKRATTGPLVAELSEAVEEIGTFELLKQGDSKYGVLIQKLTEYWKRYPDNKVVLFSYYRETLRYLHERMQENGIEAMLLMGGMRGSKHDMIERFRKSTRMKILLASEVASEGVDLQFSSFLVNYDLPWNPMRVEQRIGRIDRIGQRADRIHILNFFYAGTLDDRVYDRLFERLDVFQQALGDIESVLGEKIREMAFYLLSHDLTPEQEVERIEQTRMAVEFTKRQQEELEEEAAHLAAHGDYVLNKVKAAREMRRYIDGRDLWTYVRDALEEQFPGTELIRLADDPLTVEIGLSQSARVELQHYLENTRNLGTTHLARGHAGGRVRCVFANRVDFSSRRHEVINQYHPLVRFIISRVDDMRFHPLVAAKLSSIDISGLSEGVYLVTSQMWSTRGSRTVEKLVFKGMRLDDGVLLGDDDAENLLNAAVEKGEDWPAARSRVTSQEALDGFQQLLDDLDDRFAEYARLMEMENDDRVDFLVRSLTDKVNSEIRRIQQTIDQQRMRGESRMIKANKGRIAKRREYLSLRKPLYEKQRTISTEQANVTTVAVHVER